MRLLYLFSLSLLLSAGGCTSAQLPTTTGSTDIRFNCSGRGCFANIENPPYADGTATITGLRSAFGSPVTFTLVTHAGNSGEERRLERGLTTGALTDYFNGMTVAGSWRVELSDEPPAGEDVILEVTWTTQ